MNKEISIVESSLPDKVFSGREFRVPEYVLSMNFSHVQKSGGVIDFADNLSSAMSHVLGAKLTIYRPHRRQGRKAQVLARFLSEVLLEFKYWRRPAVALFPNYFIFPLPFSRLRRVVVVHDLQFKHYPEYTSSLKRRFLDACYRVVRRYADGVAFISAASQNDFLSLYGAPRRHAVIYNPVRIEYGSSNEFSSVTSPYVIANFHFYPHKNLPKLLECFAAIRAIWPDLRLVLTGHRPPDFDSLLGADPESLGIDHRGFLPKEEVISLVKGASFFMSLSLFEGFNISAAEASILGKPLVLSDIPVHREIFSDVALLLDPLSTDWKAGEIVDYVNNSGGREWRHLKRVSSESAANAYLQLMNESFLGKEA